MASDVYRQYQETAITQADSVKLVQMMYEGAIRFANQALKAIAEHDAEGAHNSILRAYAVVAELMATLDFDQGGEIAVKLEQCYEYILHLLKEADIKKDTAILEQALAVLVPLADTWKDAFTGKNANGQPLASLANTSAKELAGSGAEQPEHAVISSRERKPLDVLG